MVRLIAYSDYLCPWCYNGSVRLHRLKQSFGDEVVIDWHSFLLRPRPDPGRSLEKFRAYTHSWMRPAAERDAGTFRVWDSEAGPPSHSIPPHLLAKAAALISNEAFSEIHLRLMHAYFAESRDVTDRSTLAAIWAEAGLPAEGVAAMDEPQILDAVLAEHEEALELGITGVPSVRMDGREGFLMGAQPIELYERWVRRALGGRL